MTAPKLCFSFGVLSMGVSVKLGSGSKVLGDMV